MTHGGAARVLTVAIVALAVAGFALALRQLVRLPPQLDFDAYYSAARMANAHLPLYATPPDSIMGPQSPASPHREYVYPALLAGLLRPLAMLPYRWASALWLAANVAFVGWLSLLVGELLPWARRHRWWTLTAIVLLPATYVTWIEGQLSLVIAALILLAAVAATRTDDSTRRPDMMAGIALGLAGALKVYPVVLIPVFAFHRRWRIVAIAMATGMVATGAGMLLAGGVADTTYWFTHVLRAVAERPWPANQSIAAVMERLAPTAPFEVWTGVASAPVQLRAIVASRDTAIVLARALQLSLLALSTLVVVRRNRVGTSRALLADLALGILLMSLVVPVVWDHYYVQLLLPAALLAGEAAHDAISRHALLAAALLVLLQRFWRQLLHIDHSGLVLMCGMIGVFVLWGATARLCWGTDDKPGQSSALPP
jgi:hypothetical protein